MASSRGDYALLEAELLAERLRSQGLEGEITSLKRQLRLALADEAILRRELLAQQQALSSLEARYQGLRQAYLDNGPPITLAESEGSVNKSP